MLSHDPSTHEALQLRSSKDGKNVRLEVLSDFPASPHGPMTWQGSNMRSQSDGWLSQKKTWVHLKMQCASS